MTNIKEIYIVTSGSYSDYGIDEVFTNKEKAEDYVRLKNNDSSMWGGYRVETYLVDEVSFNTTKIIEVKASKTKFEDDYSFDYEIIDILADSDDRRTSLYVNNYERRKESHVMLRRKFVGDEDNFIKKCKRIVEDYFFMIESNWDFFAEFRNLDSLQPKLEEDIDAIWDKINE